ncbi:Alpha/beta hydrolase domain-containing protein [Drosera capensis]
MGAVTSSIAAKFAYFPPTPPSYTLISDPAGKLRFAESMSRKMEEVEVVRLRTRRGNDVVAMYVRNQRAAGTTVLYSHGNAADLGQMVELFVELSGRLKVNLMGYDYSGYGQSTGKPTETNTYADIDAAYTCLTEQYGVKDEQLILYGQSVGSGPTVDLASRVPNLRGVVLHSPILSGLRVLYPVKRTFWFDIYKGTADEVVDWSHGKQLWELSKNKYDPLWLNGGGHCNLELFPDYIRHLKKFVSSLNKSKVTSDSVSKSLTSESDIQGKPPDTATPEDTSELNPDLAEPSRNSLDSHLDKCKKPNRSEKTRLSIDLIDRFRRRKGLIW